MEQKQFVAGIIAQLQIVLLNGMLGNASYTGLSIVAKESVATKGFQSDLFFSHFWSCCCLCVERQRQSLGGVQGDLSLKKVLLIDLNNKG